MPVQEQLSNRLSSKGDNEAETSLYQDGQELFELLRSYSRSNRYGPGEQIVLEGGEARNLYYIEEGSVEVSHTVEGTKIIVALIGPGNFMGEIGFFDGFSRIRDIRTQESSILHTFDHKILETLKANDPPLHSRFIEFLTRSICLKFRRILEEREPMTAYAASLSTGRRSYHESVPLSKAFFQTPIWDKVNDLVEKFKAGFFDLSHQLQKTPESYVPENMQAVGNALLSHFILQLESLEHELGDSEFQDQVWGYLFKEIFPYFLRSRFAERAYYKPKGYAGDFFMMEMIYNNTPQGDGKIGLLMDRFCLESVAARAVRGRRRLLAEQLDHEFKQRQTNQHMFQVMNLACGSNRELFDFIAGCGKTENIDALCVDADSGALEYSNRQVNIFEHSAIVNFMNDNLVKWSLGRVRQDFGFKDLIYSSGLTDYLDDRLFCALVSKSHKHLKPGGVLIIGNFGPNNREKTFMDHILQWKLIHRSSQELIRLFDTCGVWSEIDVLQEKEGVNLFVKAQK